MTPILCVMQLDMMKKIWKILQIDSIENMLLWLAFIHVDEGIKFCREITIKQ